MRNLDEINRLLAEAEEELARLNARRTELLRQITELQQQKSSFLPVQETSLPPDKLPSVTNQSPQELKIALFRSLFRGREDVYPKRFESLKTGKQGYTVVRKDGHHPIVFMQCGPIRYRVDDRNQAEKRPFDHKVVVRPTTFHLPPHLQNITSPPIQDVYALLARDDQRNHLIVQDVVAAVQANRFPVLLTERREHLDLLASLLARHIQNVIVRQFQENK